VRGRVRLREEAGIALTVAMCAMAMMITLAGVALNQAVASLKQSRDNTDEKRALQAADAAIDAAAYAVSRASIGDTLDIDPLHPESIVNQNCVVTVGQVAGGLVHPDIDIQALDPLTGQDAQGNKWCSESAQSGMTGGASYSFRISQLLRAGGGTCGDSSLINLDREVVGVGRSGTEVRRVKARLTASLSLLSGAAVQSSSAAVPLTMRDSAQILGNAQSNGDITGTGGLNVIVGNATVGHDKHVTGVIPSGGSGEACQNFVIPDVDPGTTSTVNDNTRITPRCADVLTGVPVLCKLPLMPPTGSVTYDSTTRTLTVTGNGVATLTGQNYSFCSVVVTGNGMIEIPNSSDRVRIFLDDPDNCKTSSGTYVPGAGTINISGSGRFLNCHPQANPESLQIYAVGSASKPTIQTFAGTGLPTTALRGLLCGLSLSVALGEPMTIIAPHSEVDLQGNTKVSGQVAAESINMQGSSSVNPINALVNLNRLGSNPILPLYKATDYVECTGYDFDTLPATAPAQGC
jgi:type II secretory pathway pseudopilin PulG